MRRNEKGFTLMELMVVIVIVAILAAVAVPLYNNYVKDAQRTEAKAAIGAIATAEQAYFLKSPNLNPGQAATYTDLATLESPLIALLDIKDVEQKWEINIISISTTTYTVQAQYKSDHNIQVEYKYIQGTGGTFYDTWGN
jgi:prepilin-type N-terminal cleavage/methylation domain-containing protein